MRTGVRGIQCMHLCAFNLQQDIASGQISAFSLQLEGQHNVTDHPWLLIVIYYEQMFSCLAKQT